MVLFSKFGKTVKDLFKTDKYELNRTISVKCQSDNTEWSTECSFPLAEGDTKEKAVYKQTDSTFGTVEIEIPNTKPKKIDYQFPKFKDGLKVNFEVAEEETKEVNEIISGGGLYGAKISIKGEYQKDQIAGKVVVEAGDNKTLQAEVAYELSEGCWAGGEVKYALDGDLEYHLGAHITYGKVMTDVKADFVKQKVNVKLHNQYFDSGAVAADFNYNIGKQLATTSIGGAWKLDEKCNAQGFVKNTGNTYLLLKYKLSDHITASTGTSFDLSQLQQDAVDVHFKIEVNA